MLEQTFASLAALANPRFRAYLRGKDTLESFLRDQGKPFHQLGDADFARGLADPRTAAALRAFAEARELAEDANARADAAVAVYQIGITHHIRGEWRPAEDHLAKALAVLAGLPDEKYAREVSECRFHQGLVLLHQGRGEDAVAALRAARAIDLARGYDDGVLCCDAALAACRTAGFDADRETPAPAAGTPTIVANDEVEDLAPPAPPAPGPAGRLSPAEAPFRLVVWLAAHSSAARDELSATLDELQREIGRPITIHRAAFDQGSGNSAPFPEPEPDQHLAATLVFLEPAGLEDEAFRTWLAAELAGETRHPGRRLFVALRGFDRDALIDRATTDPLAADLLESTQLADSLTPASLRATLVPYLRGFETQRERAAWARFHASGAGIAAGIAGAALRLLQWAAILGLATPFLPPHLIENATSAAPWVGALGGAVIFPALVPLFFLATHGWRGSREALGSVAPLLRACLLSAAVLGGAGLLLRASSIPVLPFSAGLAAGLMLESVRRTGARVRLRRPDFDALRAAAEKDGSGGRREPRAGDPFRHCPLLPVSSARVFISYGRRSRPAAGLTASLYRRLRDLGADPFLDRASIPVGADWKREVQAQLGACDAFVSVVDPVALDRPGVAAEIIAACDAQAATGSPKVVLLLDPELPRDLPAGTLPIFRKLAAQSGQPPRPNRPLVLPLTAGTLENIAWGSSPGRLSPLSVLNRAAAMPVMLAAFVIAIAGSPAVPLGPLVLLAELAERAFGLNLLSRLGLAGWSLPALATAAYFLGISARNAAAYRFEWEHAPRGGIVVPLAAIAGYTLAGLRFLPVVDATGVIVAPVLVALGWFAMAESMDMGVNQRRRIEDRHLRPGRAT